MDEERLFLQDLSEEQEEMIKTLDAEKAQREREEREADRKLQQLRAASKKMLHLPAAGHHLEADLSHLTLVEDRMVQV